MTLGEIMLVVACMLVMWYGFTSYLLKNKDGGVIGWVALPQPVGGGDSPRCPPITTNMVYDR